ncbi:MAG: hypothetical protein HHJ12_09145 [Glaciimonas sp.]|nr:hypothetical protein [Glaciimonas sp.]
MRALLMRGLFICAIFVTVWILMVMYWRSTNRMPTSSEVVLYLLVLPVSFLFGLWLIRKMTVAVTASAAAGVAAAAVPQPDDVNPPAHDDKQERTWTLAILAGALRSPHGASPDELATALKSKEARLELDTELTDSNGFPVRTGRISDIDGDAVAEVIAAWLNSANMQIPAWTAEQLRALAMGSDVLVDLVSQALTHPYLIDYVNAGTTKRSSIELPVLQLLPVFPDSWPSDMRKTVASWFMHLIEQHGWPAEKILISPMMTSNRTEPLSLIDRLSVHSHRQSLPCFCLMIASESFIGEKSINQWDAAGQLLKGKGNTGQIPGEGAAGLLLADQNQATLMDVEFPAAIHRIAQGRREKSADANGQVSAELLSELAQDALLIADTTSDKITMLIADSDHRGSRMTELMGLSQRVFPELDFNDQCMKIAADCGAAGAVSSLTALALAHQEAAVNATFTLCTSNQDAFDRTAVVIGPFIKATFDTQATASHIH